MTYTTWTDEDKSMFSRSISDGFRPFPGLFLELAAQHGDDFKRIASSMPHKVGSLEVDGKLY